MALATVTVPAASGGVDGTATITNAQSGFVQAIYEGNDLLPTGVPNGVTSVAFSNATSLQVSKGTALPTSAVVSNSNDYSVSLVINLDH